MLKNWVKLSPHARYLTVRSARMESSVTKPEANDKSSNPSILTGPTLVPSAFDKRLLVLFKRYKSVEDVPSTINADTLSKVRSQMRIRVSNTLMVIVLICCIFVSWWGKKRAHRGESLYTIREERERQIREDHKVE